MYAAASPDTLDIEPGDTASLAVTITNTTDLIDEYRVHVYGVDATFVETTPSSLSLFPGDSDVVEITITLPPDTPAATRTLAVNVTSEADPSEYSLNHVVLGVAPTRALRVSADPVIVNAGRRATFGVVVHNDGNAPAAVHGFGIDPENTARFTTTPAHIVVPPRASGIVQVTAQGGRAWFGASRPRTFTLGVRSVPPPLDLVHGTPHPDDVTAIATFIQRPRISRWLIALLGLLAAATVFALVLEHSFGEVAETGSVDPAIVEEALAEDRAGGARIPANPGTLSGTVTSTSGGAIGGVQAELFAADDLSAPVRVAAIDDNGGFDLTGLSGGSYRLRFAGVGVEPLWYPDGLTAGDGDEITLLAADDGTVQGQELRPTSIGGVAVEVTGSVDVSDTTDVALRLVVAGQIEEGTEAFVSDIGLAADGSFRFPDVPTPGEYDLVVEKPGLATERRRISLQPGETLDGVEIALRASVGLVQGTVSGPSGPLGGARVVATDGTNTLSTVTLSTGDAGTYTLRGLDVPGQYTVTISRDGFRSETRSIALGEQSERTFDARLVPAIGAISGTAVIADQVGADGVARPTASRDITVTLSGGDVMRTTTAASQGEVRGAFGFTSLPVPGTYTLTFSGGGTVEQVRVVELDGGANERADVAVTLQVANSAITGTVVDADGTAVSQATVTLTDGQRTFTFLSADAPIGEFRFADVPPGPYTLTASRTGSIDTVQLITVESSSPVGRVTLRLGPAATVTGSVVGVQDATGRSTFDPARGDTAHIRVFLPEQFDRGEVTTAVTTASDGTFVITGLDAPETFVVAMYRSESDVDALDSAIVTTTRGGVTADIVFTVPL